MRFGPVPVAAARGAVLAHSLSVGGQKLAKGRVITCEDQALLRSEGVATVTAAVLEAGDVGEDPAAERLARAMVPDEAAAGLKLTVAHKGRVNLVAADRGLFLVDRAAVDRLNLIDPAITFATLLPFARVGRGTMVATVKIIPYAVGAAALSQAEAAARMAIGVQRVQARTAGLILTAVAGAKRLDAKAEKAIAGRLAGLGIDLIEVQRVTHEAAAMREAIARAKGDIVLMLTDAATSDLHDDGPEALRAAGGHVARFGLPVDPGNLLFYGDLAGRPFIGLPGCARSPALNGADWVLERLACGLRVTGADVAAMGVGGLLKEIPIRPQPRERRETGDGPGAGAEPGND